MVKGFLAGAEKMMNEPEEISDFDLQRIDRQSEDMRHAVSAYVDRFGRGGGYSSNWGQWGSPPSAADVVRLRRVVAVYAKKLLRLNATSLLGSGAVDRSGLIPALLDIIMATERAPGD